MNNDVQVNKVMSVNKLRPTGKEQMPEGSKETVREALCWKREPSSTWPVSNTQ